MALARLRMDLGARIRPADAIAAPAAPAPSGIAAFDEVLGGGLPRGQMTLAIGDGRTSLAMQVVAGVTKRGALCAWIDAAHAFDAQSAIGAHIDCSRLLLVEPQGIANALRAAEVVLTGGGFALLVLDRVGVRGRVPAS